MIDLGTTIIELNNIKDMLFQMYKDATYKQDISDRYDQYLAVDNAIELLIQEIPRLVTLLELYDAEGMQGYIETRNQLRPCFLVHHVQYPEWCFKKGTPGINRHKMGIFDTQHVKRFWEFKLYNKTWRIWTKKPTEEQRKAAKWDDNT